MIAAQSEETEVVFTNTVRTRSSSTSDWLYNVKSCFRIAKFSAWTMFSSSAALAFETRYVKDIRRTSGRVDSHRRMNSCSSAASTSSLDDGTKVEDDKDSGICSMYCLASCLSSASFSSTKSLEQSVTSNRSSKPLLRRSLFSNVPQTITFYLKGEKVKKPPGKLASRLTWCHNSLLPIVMRQSLQVSYFKVVDESKRWIGYWGRHLKTAQYRSIKPFQKVNHFPGAFHIGRKDRLWQHLYEMMERFPNDGFDVMPKTYVLPKDAQKLKIYLSAPVTRHVIVKPPASARGSGIVIVSKFNKIPTKTQLVVQHYIEKPFILNGFKFDLRLYVYVNSLDPLRIYLYDEGLVRFASVPYSSSLASFMNHSEYQYVHLTNYSINKFAQTDGTIDAPVPKWELSRFWNFLTEQGLDANRLQEGIKDVAIKSVLACESHIRMHQSQHSDYPFTSHELFGMDILVDETLRPWLLEMNISPSLHSSTPVDVAVKAPLAKDVLNMCGIPFPSSDEADPNSATYRVKHYFRYKTSMHIAKENEHLAYFIENNEIRNDLTYDLTDADVRCLVEFEDEIVRKGAFSLIFPLGIETQHYLTYINSPSYFNLLLSKWQQMQKHNRQVGIDILEKRCAEGYHLASIGESATTDEEEDVNEEEILNI